jgi:hypothetical protein
MTADPAPALRAFCKLRCVPAVRGLSGTQTHLGGFSFRYSHSTNSLPSFQIQMIKRIPSIRSFWILCDIKLI